MCVLKYLGSSISIFTMYYEVYPKENWMVYVWIEGWIEK